MNDRIKRRWGAVATTVGVVVFFVTVVALHLLQPDYDPWHQLMSELALGQHGWAMFVAFLGLAVAVFGVQSAIRDCGAARGYRVLLTIVATLFRAAGVFPLGEASTLHIGAITLAFVFAVLAMYLFPSAAGRASTAAPRAVSWILAAGVAASVALGQIIPIGIAQRLAAGCLLVWLAILSLRLPQQQKGKV
jgi:hypothetical membrane protein